MAEQRRWSGGITTAGFDRPKVPSQVVTNQRWPAPEVARRLKPLPSNHHITVDARIVWAVDGEEWVPATAIAWTQHHVKLSCSDRRLQVPYVWLPPVDVRRRLDGGAIPASG